MTSQIPNVRTWSKTVPPYLFTLEDLDVYVLKTHDEIVRAMGRERAADRGDLVGGAVLLLTVLAPVSGWSAWGGRLPSGQVSDGLDRPAGFAAWCFALAVLGPLLVGWRWWRSQRHRSRLEVAGVVTSALVGAATLGTMANESGVDVFAPDLVSVPVWLTVAGASVVGVLLAVASRGRRVPFRRYFRVTGSADLDEVRRLVGQLEPARHQKLLDERRRAIARLHDRGLLDDREVAEVRSLPLGYSLTLGVPRMV